jgi:hypothetical protein
MIRVLPAASTAAASSKSVGMPAVRRKSPPVPSGSRPNAASARTGRTAPSASSGRQRREKPLTTSLMVPSPPTATDAIGAGLERLARQPVGVVGRGRHHRLEGQVPAQANRRGRGQRRPVAPPCERGLTTTTVRSDMPRQYTQGGPRSAAAAP